MGEIDRRKQSGMKIEAGASWHIDKHAGLIESAKVNQIGICLARIIQFAITYFFTKRCQLDSQFRAMLGSPRRRL